MCKLFNKNIETIEKIETILSLLFSLKSCNKAETSNRVSALVEIPMSWVSFGCNANQWLAPNVCMLLKETIGA